MTALSAARATKSRALGKKNRYPVVASDIIYAGGMVMLDSAGYAAPAAASVTNGGVVGVATETVDNSSGSAGDLSVTVQVGEFLLVGSSLAQTSVGQLGYASDDQTFSHTQGSNEPRIGRIVEFVSATSGWVEIDPVA